MLEVFRIKPSMVSEAEKARFKPPFIIQVLLFLAIFLVTQMASAIPTVIVVVVNLFSAISKGTYNPRDPEAGIRLMSGLQSSMALPMLFSTVIVTILVIIYCRFIEKRSLLSMGLTRKKAVTDYLIGLLIGLAMFSACVLISFLTGALKYNGVVLGNGLGLLILFFIGFMFQGMNEEVMMRGYFMVSAATRAPLLAAVLANSFLFALMHILNSNVSVLAMINLVLFGFFASVYTLKANSLWGICAVHSIWNFVQGNLYGIPVSGMKLNASIFSFTPTDAGRIINGGGFGLEGGLAVTLVLVAAILIAMAVKGRMPEEASN